MQTLAPEGVDLAPLAAYAQTGVPSVAAILAGFSPARAAMIAASAVEADPSGTTTADSDADSGVFGRMLSGVRGLVEVRPAGSGPAADSSISRMTAAVERGDLEAALAAYEQLPAAAQEAGAQWAGMARARVETDRLMETVTQMFLAEIGATPSQSATSPAAD